MATSAKKKYKVRSEVWLYPGMAGWHFVNVDKKQSSEIKEKYLPAQAGGKRRRGFGSIPVNVTLGKTSWKTSIFPDKKSGAYLLPIKAEVRKKEGITYGDMLSYSIELNL